MSQTGRRYVIPTPTVRLAAPNVIDHYYGLFRFSVDYKDKQYNLLKLFINFF